MAGKIAVVLFVKDEVLDLSSWFAWYFLLGVDTIFVYDDHSTDGSWNVINAAARCSDVRPVRTDLTVQPFTTRQREAYLDAIQRYRSDFEWIGFFDADEFLYIENGVDLPEFLSKFPNAGAVAISWCIYGSNGHLLKPTVTAIEAFTRHSLPSFGHNRSVKSFVRGSVVKVTWRDPHTFDVGEQPYLNANGQPVHWGGPGAIAHEPDWSAAKLMHFIPRSMEHFIERIRRRSDLRGLTNEYWNVFNKNDVEDRTPLKKLPGLFKLIFNIEQQQMADFCQEVTTLVRSAPNLGLPLEVPGLNLEMFVIETSFSTILSADSKNNVIHVDRDQITTGNYEPLYAVSSSVPRGSILLLDNTGKTPLHIPHDPRISTVLPFLKTSNAADERLALKHPYLERFLTACPREESGFGRTSFDRYHAKEWETFRLVSANGLSSRLSLYPGIESVLALNLKAADIFRIASAPAASMICAAAIQLLHDEDRAQLLSLISSPLPRWV